MSIASKLPWQRPLFTCISWVFLLWYLQIIEGTPEQHLRGRKLLFNVNRDLVPLSCNANIDQATCLNWSVKFGSNSFYSTRVVVPCGECVIMDHFGNITFNDGLDIVGKLVFPDGYRVNVYSTLVVVQGILDMKATGAVTGTPSIQFIMIGNNMETVFTPVDTNANACGGNICSTGKKGIVVAGGTVNRKSQIVTLLGMPRLNRRALMSHHLHLVSKKHSSWITTRYTYVGPSVRRHARRWTECKPTRYNIFTKVCRWEVERRGRNSNHFTYSGLECRASTKDSVVIDLFCTYDWPSISEVE